MATVDDYINKYTTQEYRDYISKANEYVKSYNPNETVDYNDQRLLDVKAEQAQQEDNINKTYEDMINNSNKFYEDQINASKEYAQKQSDIQQQNTDFAIEKINQEKEQAKKDYTREQKASYVDYQKQSNQYGVNAEKIAATGLSNSGYSESSLVSMYNTYQNRVATARDGYNRAVLNYDNSIKEAQLANNSQLAQIAYNALQQQLELSLQGFQYKNNLIEAKINQINQNNSRYDTKYQNVLAQINQEIANRQNLYNQYASSIENYNNTRNQIQQKVQELDLATKEFNEKIRQFNENMAYQKQRDKVQDARYASSSSGESGLTVKDTSSSKISSIQKTLDNIYNTLTNQYKDVGQSTKDKIAELMKSRITGFIQQQYNEGNISRNEAQSLFNRYGY